MEDSEGRISLDGKRLKHLRKKMCLSQSLFVDRCNNNGGVISISTLKRAEAGKKVYYRTARDIADVFSIEVSEISISLPEEELSTSESINLSEFVIGRSHQLEQSKFILRSIKDSNTGHLYYIRGLAGIGKSHLIKAIHKISQAEGFFVVKLSVFEASTTRKEILKELLENVLLKVSGEKVLNNEILENFIDDPHLSPEQQLCLYSILDFNVPPQLRLVSTDYSSRTKAEISLLLYHIKKIDQPVAILIEDIHWADDSLLMTLKIIASEIRNMRTALVLTSRLENDPLNKIWRSSVQNTPFTTLDLPPLSQNEVKSLADTYSHIPQSYSLNCLDLVQGNPLYLKLLLENYPNSLKNIPSSLTHLVEHKVDKLNRDEKEFINISSAIGHQFALNAVKTVLGADKVEIDNLIEKYFIHPVDEEIYQFSHDLVREAIYQCIPKKKKYKIHQQIADFFKDVNSSLHAFHLKQANNNKAVKALQEVAEKHYMKHDYSEALVQVDMALSISESFSLIFLKGTLLKMLDLPAKSTQFFEKALKLAKSELQKLEVCLELTDVYAVNQRYERSQYYLEIAEELFKSNPAERFQSRINKYKRHLIRIQNSLNSVNSSLQYSQPEDLSGRISELNINPDKNLKNHFSGVEKIAILHSTTGFLKEHEVAVMKTSIMAIDEINENGGLLGKKIEYEIFDGESDEWVFKSKAGEIINDHKMNTIFGCSISSTRKQVKEVVEKNNSLLIYPFHYEGLEMSTNIAYIGPTPNLQAIPAIEWLSDKGIDSFYFIGSDYIYPLVTNEILKDSIESIGASVCSETYVQLGTIDFQQVIEDIRSKKPDCIVMTLAGLEGNKEFLRQLYEAGLKDKSTILSLVLSDNDICEIPTEYCSGVYSLFSYFQNHNDVVNDDFVREFKARYGKDQRVGGYMESGYVGVQLWAKAVQKCKSFDPMKVKEAMKGVSHYGPGGIAYLDENNQHVWRYVRIAQVGQDGEYHVIWSSDKPVAPEPYPLSRTRDEWEDFLANLKKNRWGGKWELQTGSS